ncbi:MAG: DUF4332 domain-containing protein [Acidimicrobiales bacterium]
MAGGEATDERDLTRVRGIGDEYRDLLNAAGVESVIDLRRRNATNLTAALADANANAIRSTRRSIVRRVPSQTQVERWIAHASVL